MEGGVPCAPCPSPSCCLKDFKAVSFTIRGVWGRVRSVAWQRVLEDLNEGSPVSQRRIDVMGGGPTRFDGGDHILHLLCAKQSRM